MWFRRTRICSWTCICRLKGDVNCRDFDDPKDCRKYNTFIARMFGAVLRSDRRACIMQIKEHGAEEYARAMAASGAMTMRC